MLLLLFGNIETFMIYKILNIVEMYFMKWS